MRLAKIFRRSVKNTQHILQRRPAMIWVSLLITKRCTQRCMQCAIPLSPSVKNAEPTASLKRIIDIFDDYGTQILTISGGEPMLHPQLDDILKYATTKQFIRIHLQTTLYGPQHLIDRTIESAFESDLSLSTSFDGFGAVADELRGAKNVAEIVMRSLETIQERNSRRLSPIPISANVVINRLNLAQIPQILDYLESVRVPVDVDIYRWASTNQQEQDELKIEDSSELRRVLALVRQSPIVFTPRWLIDGFPSYLSGNFPKYCPYLKTPSLGSKFYIEPDGEVVVCIGGSIGNLRQQTPNEIFRSDSWRRRLEMFGACRGCWNTCYTPSARLFHIDNAREALKAVRMLKNKSVMNAKRI